jgi:hypothetical protein
MPFKYKNRSKKTPLFKKPIFLVIAVVLVAVGVFSALEKTGVINVFHKRNPGLATVPVTPKRTGGVETKGDTSQQTGNTTTTTEDQNKMPGDTSNTPLKAPSGNFVSNHHPFLSSQPGLNQMQSNCVTTSGATCTIVFTKGSDVKQLPVQNTDREGAAYWSWKLQDIGLTAGTWKVQAKAALGSQVQTTDDAIDLVVSQ